MPLMTQPGAGSLAPSTLGTINTLAAGIFPTQGNIWFVNPNGGSDNNPGTASAPFATLAQALAMATAGQNDIVYLCASSNTASKTTNYLMANLNWNKDLVHLIGVNAGPFLSQRSRISNLSTVASFANLFTVSANGCLISGIEFFQGAGSTTLGAAQTCVTVSGQRNVIRNCMISGMGDTTLDFAGSNSLTLTGSENVFDGCYIGLDTVIRATSVTEVIISGTPARNLFRGCQFETYTSGSTFKMVTIPTGADRWVKFVDCDFIAVQNIASAVAPTGALGITTMNGQVIMRNPYVYGFAQIVTADNAYVQVLGLNGLATGHLIGIAQGVDAA